MKVGFVGAGKMGLPIAWNIARATGQHVVVCDPAPVTLPDQARADAHLFSFVTDASALSDCSIVILCLPDSKVVSAVVEGSDERPGLIDVLAEGSLILDCGSSIPAETRRLAALLAEKGIGLHDAPVSGGLARAWKGELTVMAGGIVAENPLRPLVQCFAAKVVHLDRVGDGHVMKVANNYLLAANIVSFVEALRFAREAGISFEKFGEIVNSSSGASYVSRNKLDVVALDDDTVSFTSGLIAKDVRNFMASYRCENLDMPLVPAVLSVWERAIDQIGADADSMKIFHTVGEPGNRGST